MELELWLVGEGFVEISVWNRRTASSLNPFQRSFCVLDEARGGEEVGRDRGRAGCRSKRRKRCSCGPRLLLAVCLGAFLGSNRVPAFRDRKSTRLNSSHANILYA